MYNNVRMSLEKSRTVTEYFYIILLKINKKNFFNRKKQNIPFLKYLHNILTTCKNTDFEKKEELLLSLEESERRNRKRQM